MCVENVTCLYFVGQIVLAHNVMIKCRRMGAAVEGRVLQSKGRHAGDKDLQQQSHCMTAVALATVREWYW